MPIIYNMPSFQWHMKHSQLTTYYVTKNDLSKFPKAQMVQQNDLFN